MLGALSAHAAPKLTIERVALHQFEDGPVLAATYIFVPGETGYFSCRFTGYQIEKKDEDQRVQLAWHIRVMDPAGVLLEKEQSGRMEEHLCLQHKEWMPKFLTSFVVPPFAPGGIYRIPVTVKDELDGSETRAELTFRVQGHEVEPSDTLVARNFQFLRSEDDRAGLRTAVYHPGETLWARFDIAGYKFEVNNRFSVDYGLAILNAAGEQVFSQPEAATESKESFYPQRYVPGMLSLNLDQSVPKASYTLVVTIRDKIGNQTGESRQSFQVD